MSDTSDRLDIEVRKVAELEKRVAELEAMLATRDEAEKRLQYLTELSAKSAHRQLNLEAALRHLLNLHCANPVGCTTPEHYEAWHALSWMENP